MARYRQKDSTDLSWNAIRRRITRELDTEIMNWRERALNELLPAAWEAYEDATAQGEELVIESHVADWVGDALEHALTPKKQALDISNLETFTQTPQDS